MSLYHVWFSTKGRKEALLDEVASDIKRLLRDIAASSSMCLLELETAVDHVHLLVELAHSQSLPSVMHQLKGASARRIFMLYPELKFDLGQTSFWQKGYGWRRVSPSETHTVRRYIRSQESKPVRREA